MKFKLAWVSQNVLVALAYFVVGKLALLLAIPPGFVSPVWPSAGIALAAVVIWGYWCLPGIFIGSFATNLLVSSISGVDITQLQPISVAAGIALGATLQALVSAGLVNRFCQSDRILNDIRQLMSLLFFGGVIGCLVNGIVGPSVLFATSVIPKSIYLLSMFTWWAGDAIGVILFTPVLLLWAQKQSSSVRKLVVTLPMLAFCAITVVTFFIAMQDQQDRKQRSFDAKAQQVAAQLEKNIQVYLNILKSIEHFINASDSISAASFDRFTREFLDKYPGIQSLQWDPLVTHQQRPAFEAKMRAEGFEHFVIKERITKQNIEPAAKRDFYFPITYLSPLKGNEAAHGFDVYAPDEVSNNVRQALLNQARDHDIALTTGRISLVQAADSYGLLIYNPVYSNALNSNTVQARRQHLIGYTTGVFIMPKMLATIAQQADSQGMDLVVREIDSNAKQQLLFDSRTIDHQEPKTPLDIAERAMTSQMEFNVAGHRWQLTFQEQADQIVIDQGWYLWSLLLGGLLVASAFGVFLLSSSARAELIKQEVNFHLTNQFSEQQIIEQSNANSRFWLTFLAGVVVLSITLMLWHQFKQQEQQLTQVYVDQKLNNIATNLLDQMEDTLAALKRMGLRWDSSSGTSYAQWQADAKAYIQNYQALTTIEWVDNSYHVQWFEPERGNESIKGLNIAFDQQRRQALLRAAIPDKITLTPPLDLVQGYRAILSYIPLYQNQNFDGFLVGIFRVKNLFSSIRETAV